MKQNFRPADSLNILFCLLLMLITFFHYKDIPSAKYLIFLYASMILFQATLVKLCFMNSILKNIRDFVFPTLSIFITFDTLELIVYNVNPQDIDYLLIRLDFLLFGVHPTIAIEKIYNPLLSDILQLAYSTYYFLPISLGIALKINKRQQEFEKSLFLIMLCFYISFIGYLFFPALGPRYAMAHLYESDFKGFLVADYIHNFLNILEGIKRNAFPSGHTGISLMVLLLSFLYVRKLFWILLVPIILLILATVYCRYHYVVDVLGGIFLLLISIVLGEIFYNKYLKKAEVKC
ncbi:MAG: phosphatase PAP2 family protein [Thermodesulfovibrionales bacterium]|nr:phosphatase PAP2 family protein [Thermodesulfovibrionales bacterium]